MKKKTPPARRRNASATQAAILSSARQAFARAGYDRVGVREIAKDAGVTAMFVNRYFGSKEQLFAEVVADLMARPIILTPHTLTSPTAGEEIAAARVSLTATSGAPQHHAIRRPVPAPPKSDASRLKPIITRC